MSCFNIFIYISFILLNIDTSSRKKPSPFPSTPTHPHTHTHSRVQCPFCVSSVITLLHFICRRDRSITHVVEKSLCQDSIVFLISDVQRSLQLLKYFCSSNKKLTKKREHFCILLFFSYCVCARMCFFSEWVYLAGTFQFSFFRLPSVLPFNSVAKQTKRILLF